MNDKGYKMSEFILDGHGICYKITVRIARNEEE